MDSGHSRIPVYKKRLDNVVGILYLRELANRKRGALTAAQIKDPNVEFIAHDAALDHVLNAFIKTKRHLFVVVNESKEMVGVVTIEDILEEIIGTEIVDEYDKKLV